MCCCFFSAEPDNLSMEPAETDSEDDNNDAKNERSQVGTTEEEIGWCQPPLRRSTWQKQLLSLCHLCDQEIREKCRREDDLPCVTKRVHICLMCKISGELKKKKKRNIVALTPQFKTESWAMRIGESGKCKFFKVNVLAKHKNIMCKRTVKIVLNNETFYAKSKCLD